MKDWLQPTRQLDLGHPKLRITAQKLTQRHQCHHLRAAAVHDFVRQMPFFTAPGSSRLRASEVLARGQGDCHSKGVLFTALCRAAGLPARLLLVRVRTRFLAGMLESGPDTMTHVVGQVRFADRWVSTDGYVVDPVMFDHAQRSLQANSLDSGWGIVLDAPDRWDGRLPCLQQFRASDVVETLGAYSDLDEYRRKRRSDPPRWLDGMKHAIGARLVNRRAVWLRRQPVLGA